MTIDIAARTMRVGAASAEAVARAALVRAGVPGADATQVAAALVETSLRGVDTHGLRLLPQYLDELARGIAVPRPKIRVVQKFGGARGWRSPLALMALRKRRASVLLDAGAALGVVAGLAGVRVAAKRARRYGVAAVGIRNSNHFGAAAVYSRALAGEGLVGIVTTSAASRVAPFGGVQPLFGTNPISVAAGSGEAEFALDMATSQVSFGKIKETRAGQRRLEPGWATDATGRPALDPGEAYALSPLGGYKGHGLAMAVTLLGALLNGMPPDWQLDQIGESPEGRSRQVGHLIICLDPAAFAGADLFAAGLDQMLDTVRTAPAAAADGVLVPGDPERAHASDRYRNGLPLDPQTGAALTALASELGIALEVAG
jgi:LDH2 family malate/lactate/ureidoglycolate dehydrogenase